MLKLTSLLENNQKYLIYLDMDDVLCDFEGQFELLTGHHPTVYKQKFGDKEFWRETGELGVNYWATMPWMSDGKKLWNFVKGLNVKLLTAPPSTNSGDAKRGKLIWAKKNLGNIEVIFETNKYKYATPTSILIDDRPDNINKWKSAGGVGILHTSATKSISELKGIFNEKIRT